MVQKLLEILKSSFFFFLLFLFLFLQHNLSSFIFLAKENKTDFVFGKTLFLKRNLKDKHIQPRFFFFLLIFLPFSFSFVINFGNLRLHELSMQKQSKLPFQVAKKKNLLYLAFDLLSMIYFSNSILIF